MDIFYETAYIRPALLIISGRKSLSTNNFIQLCEVLSLRGQCTKLEPLGLTGMGYTDNVWMKSHYFEESL
jgi:hypothetical protein